MLDIPELTLDILERAVAGDAAAFRVVTRLQPAGGKGDKVFPPTYAADRNRETLYATELRIARGEETTAVLLDSVASQANRMEEALYAAWEDGKLDFPIIPVDFSAEEGLSDLDRITTLHAPHRIADALLRDSVDESGTLFRDTKIGRAYTDASTRNATAIYQFCPTALVFGVWDSTGPRGGLGNKIQRALVSEIVGYHATSGVKTKSRIDPAGIQANVDVFHRADNPDDWTTSPDEAQKKKGIPIPFSRKGTEGKGKPSAINHSNVAPTVDVTSGGVTFEYAEQTTVLSLPALRRLRFVNDGAGARFEAARRAEAEAAARTAIAALALCAVTEQLARGYDLRSRSLFVPESGEPPLIELVPPNGGEPRDYRKYRLTAEAAVALLAQASLKAAEAGLPWDRVPLTLRPAPKLAALIRESRRRAAQGETEETEKQA